MARVLKKMACPIDWMPLASEKIALVRALDVQIDRCPKCQGVYLDKGEIRRITGQERLHDLLTKHVGLDSDSPRVCPGCGMVMDMEDADGVRVDVCLSCNGVWLDRGELEVLKQKPDSAFDPSTFSEEKRKELERAKTVKAENRRKSFSQFLRRLTGQDLMRRN